MEEDLCGKETQEQKPEERKPGRAQPSKGRLLREKQGLGALGRFTEQQGDRQGDTGEGTRQRRREGKDRPR